MGIYDKHSVDQYKGSFLKKNIFGKYELTDEQMLHMINWFSSGALTEASNKIYDMFDTKGAEALVYTLETSCRCMSCHCYAFVDENGKHLKEFETLEDLVDKV